MTVTSALPIFDGHNDTLLSLYTGERGKGTTFFERSEKGHIDLPRARAGGLRFAGGARSLCASGVTSLTASRNNSASASSASGTRLPLKLPPR